MTNTNPTQIHATGEATGFIPAPGDKGRPITVIGTNSIRAGYDATCLEQALNERLERVAKQIEAALPNILNLTNQLSIVLSNSTRLTAHLDETTLELQPGLRNLTLLSAQLTNGPGALGEWLLPTNLNQQLSTTLVSAHASLQAAGNTLTNVDTNLVMLATGLNKTLINLASATSNLNAQVQANDKILSQLSAAVIHADEFVQGLKRHWLLRSAFKEKPTNQSPREVRPSTPKGGRSR